ncbi:MAG: nuclease-like protein, partial [Phycisphaerales bacterium]|nr:nuclease-like protein [Phycisphaerales bacterium]
GAAELRALRQLDGPQRRIGRERIKNYRGAQGEALVGWQHQDLPGDWHVFHGMQLEEASDLDHVVVGPGGLFCVSTKSNRGLLSAGADGAYLLNGKPTEFVRQVQRQTMRLRDRLAALLGRVPWVQPVLAVPLAWVAFDSFQSAAWVLHQDNLLKALSEQPPRLGPDEVARVVRALEMIMANAKDLYERPVPRAPGGGEPAAGPGGDTAAKA